MLNKTINNVLAYQRRQRTQLALGDLPTLLENWQQAISAFKDLHKALGEFINRRRQVAVGLTHQYAENDQLSVNELETIRLNMLTELRYLLNDMNRPQGFAWATNDIKRMHRHTLRLQKHNLRLLRTIG